MIKSALTFLSGLVALGNKAFDYFRDKKIEQQGVDKQKLSDAEEALHEAHIARIAVDSDVVGDFVQSEYDAAGKRD